MTTIYKSRRRGFQSPTRTGFWRLWKAVCKRHGWVMNDDNRHALYRRALGYFKHQNEFGNKEWDLVFEELRRNLKGLISEGPESLGGVTEAGERARKIHSIERVGWPEAYIIKIASDKFSAFADWRNLAGEELEDLRITLIERKRAKERAAKRGAEQGKIDFQREAEVDACFDRAEQIRLEEKFSGLNDSYYET